MKQMIAKMRLPVALIMAGSLLFTSCKKDPAATDEPTEAEINQSFDAALSSQLTTEQFNDVLNISLGVQEADAGEEIGIGSGAGILYKPGDGSTTLGPNPDRCFTVTVVPKVRHEFPKTVTIDFGDGCEGLDGKVRKGKIVVIYTGPAFVPGSKVSTTFLDYSVDSFAVEGTLTVENTSTDEHFGWKVEVINGKITNTESGRWHKRDGVRTHTRVEGNGTPLYFRDDVYAITGHGTGSNSNGNSWKGETVEPLIWMATCHWITAGIIELYRNDNSHAITIDFGDRDDDCNNKATISYRGHTREITL